VIGSAALVLDTMRSRGTLLAVVGSRGDVLLASMRSGNVTGVVSRDGVLRAEMWLT
jgi:hypothetical protein